MNSEYWQPGLGTHFKEINSTNDWLKKNYSGVGDWVWAEHQREGRGRGDHNWHSPEGGLYLSVCVPRKEPLTLISLAVANAVVEFCQELDCDVTVKWPNDILLSGKKCGGILSEVLDDVVVCGIGLNFAEKSLFEGASYLRLESVNMSELSQKLVEILPKWTSMAVSETKIQKKWLEYRKNRSAWFLYESQKINGRIKNIDLIQNLVLLESEAGQHKVAASQLQELLP